MSNTLDRISFEYRTNQHTPDVNPFTHIVNPDLTPVLGVDKKYWILTGDVLSVMNAAAQAVVDAAAIIKRNISTAALLTERTAPYAVFKGIDWSIAASGLEIIFNLNSLIIDDRITISVDASLVTYAQAVLVHNLSSFEYYMVVTERTDGSYEQLDPEEQFIVTLGEWSVEANGTDLVEVGI